MSEDPKKKAATVEVLSEDPEADPSKKKEDNARLPSSTGPKEGAAAEDEDDDLSAEDRKLKEDLGMLVTRLTEEGAQDGVRMEAAKALVEAIRSSTTSMTSIPKPLKFLRAHYDALVAFNAALDAAAAVKGLMADIMSVLAMTMGQAGKRESLHFLLEARAAGRTENVGYWGHNYVSHMAGEVGAEWAARDLERGVDDPAEAARSASMDEYADLYAIVGEIVPHNMESGAETDAVDLLLEVLRPQDILPLVSPENVHRVCDYIVTCADYAPVSEDRQHMREVAARAFLAAGRAPEALRVVLCMEEGPDEMLPRVFEAAGEDEALRKQLALMMGAHLLTDEAVSDESEDLAELSGNCHLSSHFLHLAAELDVKEAKEPEDIYKSHLAEGGPAAGAARRGGGKVDSAKANLAATFVNAFVNMGFGNDKLVTPERSEWIYKNKDHGMMSAAASLGAIKLWDVETSFSDIDKYSYSSNDHVKAGAMLATGLITSGVTSDMDAAFALLSDHVEDEAACIKIGAALGLGIAYAGTGRSDLLESLVPLVVDGSLPVEVSGVASLALGLVFVGTACEDVVDAVIQAMVDRSDTELNDSAAKMMALALGLNLLGRGESCEATLDVVAVVEHPLRDYITTMVEICAYAGSGNVLIVQKLLGLAGAHPEKKKEGEDGGEEEKKDDQQAAEAAPAAAAAATPAAAAGAAEEKDGDDASSSSSPSELPPQHALAVLGIALVTFHEDLGQQMALRSMDHILQYAEPEVRKAVPLALSLLSVSNPSLTVMDTLSKLSHDSDEEMSQNALLALGFIGAGTNNSRIANLLRNASVYYGKEPNHLFLCRVAQGLLHMGKGLLTLDPVHAERRLLSAPRLAGLLVVLHASLDAKNNVLGKRHYLLYALVCAARPRMLVTVDEEMEAVPVKVKVGQAVDVVGVAGKPKRLTGFQTHTTPVLLSHGDRAELATDEWLALTPVLEGVVVVRKNPEWKEDNEGA